MADSSDFVAGIGGGLGGLLLGRSLADSDLANKMYVRWLTRKPPAAGQPDFRVPVYAGADLNLTHGSGEAVMASRMSRMLNQNGIGSYYSNTNWRPNNSEIAGGNLNNDWFSPTVKANPYLWSDDVKINGRDLSNIAGLRTTLGGKQSTALNEIVKAMTDAGVPRDRALGLLRSGMFDKFTPGELLDTFKVSGKQGVADIAAGRAHIMPYAELGARYNSGGSNLPYMLTGEAGMDYSTLAGTGAAKAIGENSYPFPRAPNTRNLSLDTRFQANYRSPNDPLLPGSGMYDPGFGRRSRFGRMWKYYAPGFLGGGERSAYMNAIRQLAIQNGVDPKTLPRNGRYMLISTGAAGANAAEKLRLAAKAFEGDPNVRILLQYGKQNPLGEAAGLDIYTNNGVMDEVARINARRPGFVMAAPRLQGYDVLARNVDLHGTYGGSSTITEALSHTNPTVTMTDTLLNRRNNDYGTARGDIPQVNSAATALGRERARLAAQGVPTEEAMARRINMRDGGIVRLGDTIRELGLENADYGKIEQDAIRQLQDAMYGSRGKFDPARVEAANEMLRERTARNREFVKTVRQAVLGAVDRYDTDRYRRMKPGLRKGFNWAARRMFANPAGRRIGIPLARAVSLGGLIGVPLLRRMFSNSN